MPTVHIYFYKDETLFFFSVYYFLIKSEIEVKFDVTESLQFKNLMHLLQLNGSSGWKPIMRKGRVFLSPSGSHRNDYTWNKNITHLNFSSLR